MLTAAGVSSSLFLRHTIAGTLNSVTVVPGLEQWLALASGSQHHQQRSATKKAGGTAHQAVGSHPKHLGMKMSAGELAFPGMIILRQRGTKFHAGANVGMGRDHTIFATGVGSVRVSMQPGPRGERRVVSVEPLPEAVAAASAPSSSAERVAATDTRLRQVEAELVQRRAQIKRAMLRGSVPLEPALYFPLPTTLDGQLSWLERTVPKTALPSKAAAVAKAASGAPVAAAPTSKKAQRPSSK